MTFEKFENKKVKNNEFDEYKKLIKKLVKKKKKLVDIYEYLSQEFDIKTTKSNFYIYCRGLDM